MISCNLGNVSCETRLCAIAVFFTAVINRCLQSKKLLSYEAFDAATMCVAPLHA